MQSTEEFIHDLFKARIDAKRGARNYMRPALRLVLTFLAIILLGALLLLLPWSTPPTKPINLVDALFTSTSAVCVTGLIVRDTATGFTGMGQTIILFLIQIGGLGYMMIATMFAALLGRRIGVTDNVAIQQALNLESGEGMGKFIRDVVLLTLVLELIGTIVLTIDFLSDQSFGRAAAFGSFHAISAFNNAGFCLFSDNLMGQTHQPAAIVTISILAVLGGLGYLVIHELLYWLRQPGKRLSLHTKLVLVTTLGLSLVGALVLFATTEMDWINSIFMSTVARTSGFNITDTGNLSVRAQFIMIPLMFIGASPGGTGGGIKTTTFAILILVIWSTLRGKREIIINKRHVDNDTIYKSLIIFLIMSMFLVMLTFLLEIIVHQPMENILFEMTSALGTVGLSLGNGENLSLATLFSVPGKLLVIASMFFGRLGPITIGLAAAINLQKTHFKYPSGRVSIG